MLHKLLKSPKDLFLSFRRPQLFLSGTSISYGERFVVFLFFAFFTGAFCYFQLVAAFLHHLDAAFLMEALTSIKETGYPTTFLGQALIDASSTFMLSADAICKADLIPSVNSGVSVLENHAYFILYPLAAFTWLFPPHAILAVANGLSFAAVIFILYWVIRRQGIPFLGAIAFCLLVMAHPAWSHASLGDFYSDRLFMPLGLLYISLLYDAIVRQPIVSRRFMLLVLFVGLLAASTTERGAIMIALFTIAFLVLYRKSFTGRGTKFALSIFSLALLIYVFLYVKFLHVYVPFVGDLSTLLQGIPLFFENIKTPEYALKLKEFIVINVLLFGIFALFDWRLAIVGFAVLLPNLLTNIGGAEKTGWGTHYHSMYFPFLVFAAAMGYSKLWNLLRVARYRLMLIGVLLVLITAISNYSRGYGSQIGAVKHVYDFYTKGELSGERQASDQLRQIAAAIPVGVKVTTPEQFVPILYRDRTIYFYPVGIDIADYAVLSRVAQLDGSFYYAGAVSYIGESQKVDICLTERLRKAGYNVDHPKLLLGNMAVLERQKN